MGDESRKISAGELREKLRALARKTHTSDPNELARLAKDAGFDCSAEEITAIAREQSWELGEAELEGVAGGHTSYDWSQNKKV